MRAAGLGLGEPGGEVGEGVVAGGGVVGGVGGDDGLVFGFELGEAALVVGVGGLVAREDDGGEASRFDVGFGGGEALGDLGLQSG